MKQILIVCILAIAIAAAFAMKSYHGHTVFRLYIKTQEQIDAIEQMETVAAIDVWSEHVKTAGTHLDVCVEESKINAFKTIMFDELKTKYEVIIENVQDLIDEEKLLMSKIPAYSSKSNAPSDFFEKYRTSDEYYDFVQSLHLQFPDLTSLFTIGKTLEGREILGIKIGKPQPGQSKRALVFNSLQHAREYISGTVTMYIAHTLLNKYSTDPSIQKLVDSLDFHIIPIVNVDGYNFTFTGDRLWRKNRRVNEGSSCRGVDTNRNWDYQWNATGGSSTNKCSDTYRGPSPFSEPESTAIGNYTINVPNLKGYIDFHSYSQLWMRPWGFTKNAPKDEPVMKQVGDACAAAIKKTHGVAYESGRISIIIYEASGSSVDFVYGKTQAISFGVELRDTGRYGFMLPPAQIIPTGEENFAAILEMANYILQE